MQWAWHLDPYFKYHSSEQPAIMKSLISIAVNCALFFHAVSAQKYVFAHVVVGDTAAHTLGTWASELPFPRLPPLFMFDIAYGNSNVLI
jgi:hypothetical protein